MKKILENKFISGVVLVLLGLFISWGIWVTNGVYKTHETATTTVKTICSDINKLQIDTKEIRLELKEQRELIYINQEKILEKLGGISKSLKMKPNSEVLR